MSRITLDKIEFYITNVCNLACSHCNRFNDYHFTGWQRWSDYADDYALWSKYIDFKKITILGGEPLLNPTITEWIKGINQLWPDAIVQVLTNGTRLNNVDGLYELMPTGTRNWLGISLHNEYNEEEIFTEVKSFLKGQVTVLEGKNSNSAGADWLYRDENGVQIGIWRQDTFARAALTYTADNKLTLHNSDPYLAHRSCGFATWKNYHLIRGKLYKCGPVALFPEFDQQHPLELSPEDRQLINSYQPLSAQEFETRGAEFLANIDNPLAQCKFCPERYETEKIFAIRKGSKKP